MTRILAVETSCDETSVAIVEDGRRICANEVASQVAVHAPFGGVVPEIASRQHIRCISQLHARAMQAVDGSVHAVAATCGPGLMGSLLVGVNFAKALAFSWGVPYIPVHHLEGHIFSTFLTDDPPRFPFLALLVSGGHTSLIWCEAPLAYRALGSTRDDAVGECFDKVARLLGLPYPGGPSIQQAAETGNPNAYAFPRAMSASDSFDFSYSGLKTAVLYELQKGPHPVDDMAASFQAAAVDILLIKTRQAIDATDARRVVIAGGVAANRLLRQRFTEELDVPVHVPPLALCVDNAAMIAAAAYARLERGCRGDLDGSASSTLALGTA